MDYTSAPLTFRARKAARYVRLYGPRRTLVKIRGQYHMRTAGPVRGRRLTAGRPDAHIGLIGCGNFAFSHIAYFLDRNVGPVIRAAMDVEGARAESIAGQYGMHYATEDARRVIEDPDIDLVYIASNHASHAEYAIQALEAGKNVHIEKPHAVDDDQLLRLCRTMERTAGSVRLGFNRPASALGQKTRSLLASQEGAMMLNWFVAGHEIPPDHWYYRPEEGGRILGNLCHWTDFSMQMVDREHRFPVKVCPTRGAKADSDIAVAYVFADDSIAAITFSAKGHAFEGVREHLSAHRGNVLLALEDFKELRAQCNERRQKVRLRFRDHGHEGAIMRSYAMSAKGGGSEGGVDIAYVWETGQLFLRTREALEQERNVVVEGYSPSGLAGEPVLPDRAIT